MKRYTFNILIIFFSLVYFEAKAGDVSLDTNQFPVNGIPYCGALPYTATFDIKGFALGYPFPNNDTMDIHVNFGDGNDTIIQAPLIPIDSVRSNYFYFFGLKHDYTLSGRYSIKITATAPDSASDVLIRYNFITISDSCGNISGNVYNDLNSDCVFNAADQSLESKRVDIFNNNQLFSSTWTDSSGNYWFEVPNNLSYFVKVNNYVYSVGCPSIGSYTVSTFPSNNNNFAMECLSGFDFFSSFNGRSIPGQTLRTQLMVHNTFCKDTTATVKLIFNDSLFSYAGNASVAPSSINADTLEWSFTSNSNQLEDYFIVDFSSSTDTSAQMGDTICVTVIIDTIMGDSNLANNISEFCIAVRTSYDPNIKVVQPLGVGNQGEIAPNTDLTYTIHFQNTGTAPAYNVYILDTIDHTKLDMNSIEILGSSHDMKTNIISSDILRFRFEDIMLADSMSNEPESHGWLTYSIKQQANLTNGMQIRNSAAIYFDYNPAVLTDATLNTINDGTVGINEISTAFQNVLIYPNPTNSQLYVNIKEDNFQLDIYDLSGRMVKSIENKKEFAVDNLENGLYILKITIEGSVISKKLIVQH